MNDPIEFLFDYSSPYGYIASHVIDGVAARHGRPVTWRPFMLGAVFKVAGTQPLTEYPLKGDYSKHDFLRSARLYKVPFAFPPRFPLPTVTAARLHYVLETQGSDRVKDWDRAIYAAYFRDGRDISDSAVVAAVADELGLDGAALVDATADPAIKARLKDVTDQAIGRGVFGSPFFFVDGEPFWGSDRIDMLDRWLATGGW